MGVVLYNVLLVLFIIPVTIRAYLSLKKGKHPLPYFQNNAVVNRIKLEKAIGIASPIVFWVFHIFLLLWNFNIDAWLGVLAVAVYMVTSSMLSAQIKVNKIGVIPESAGPVANDNLG